MPLAWTALENIAWKTPLTGDGWSSPIVWQDAVFVTTATDEGQSCHVLALDRKTGKILRDLDDARAYARWVGQRLPTEGEWQYAAQGGDGRAYPWGNEMEPDRCNDGKSRGTTPVSAFPLGRSPFGCYDMCGNVWQWTESERSDGRTRFCIIRGGSFFSARGSNWYVDGGPRPANFATKFLLMWPGLDRCATIGFRCVKDLE